MKVEFAPEAGRDVDDILAETLRRFGGRQVDVYAGYLKRAVELLTENHLRASSLYYREMTDGAGEPIVVIVRVLHERMDPTRHTGDASADGAPAS